MLKRKIEKEIMRWIETGEKALLIYGVRQAGKTFIIRECLEAAGCDYIEFNLIRQPEIIDILDKATGIDDLILKLSLYSDKKIVPGKTFFFFDEIQKYKEIVTRIKFLVDDKRFRYIMSGSLLGVEITNLKSAPVGYLQSIKMYPLDFEEFLQIFGVEEPILSRLRSAYIAKTPVDEVIHRKIMEMFNLYLIIGGMPAAVEKYRTTGSIDDVMDEHRSIIEQYKLDFTQYEEENRRLIITRIYEMIPAELNEKNKRFMVADVRKNLRYDRIADSFIWLWKAGVALGVFNTTEPTVPLLLNEKSSLFKMFLSDVGLLTTIYGKACKLKIVNKESDINKGAVYENVVAQELYAHGYPLYYYNSKKKGELDFVIEHAGKVLPIEVKSGKDYEKHSALDNVMNAPEYEVNEAYVFTNDNIKTKGKVTYLPIYMVMFLKDEPIDFTDISIDRFKI
ncbi:ATP-binding protein [Bacteroides heparinolyticus]|uniref:ATP-binding protein n=1 Tax=Prevotella heparinolytica TaxID=28113 RepID=UPI0035A0E44F